MATEASTPEAPRNSLEILERAGRGEYFDVVRMPDPAMRLLLPMRDGVRLETWIWAPDQALGPTPAILVRTPYQEHIVGWPSAAVERCCGAGYTLIYQLIRGVGASEGAYVWNSRQEGEDGYDTVEWIASQPWCDGAVGMDGASYGGMTQLWAASQQPPHLRCMIPSSPSLGPLQHIAGETEFGAPYSGGAFGRHWMINWLHLISVASLREMTGGFVSVMPILSKPEWLSRMMSRPLIDAADEILTGDQLNHYRGAVSHPVFDDWWLARSLQPADWARMDVPALIFSGNFDGSIGQVLSEWRALEAYAPTHAPRTLIIGPWQHGLTPMERFGPYDFMGQAPLDLAELKMAFLARHLKGEASSAALRGRVNLFVTGANVWRQFDQFPPTEVSEARLYLHSGGAANSARGDGRLTWRSPSEDEPPDSFIGDPDLPFVATFTNAIEGLQLDLREAERCHERLVYRSAPLDQPMTILGEPTLVVFISADAPDCDLVGWLAEHQPNGSTTRLASGVCRLRYRHGFGEEALLTPGHVERVFMPLSYIAHQLSEGSELRLILGADDFPRLDPNPNTGEPIATAVETRTVTETIFHDSARPSCLRLPLLGGYCGEQMLNIRQSPGAAAT